MSERLSDIKFGKNKMMLDENNSVHSIPPFANQENKLLAEKVCNVILI